MRNFWTEENKIMNYDSLICADLRNKLIKLDGQMVVGKDLADICYNYDYLIASKRKAVQFISDYADDFIDSLRKYKQTTGVLFPDIDNPLKIANLMALYKGRDILKTCEYIKNNWDKKFTMDAETIETLLKELEELELQENVVLEDKAFTTKETLSQVCLDLLYRELESCFNSEISKQETVEHLMNPKLSERTMKSMLINSYMDISEIVKTKDDIDLTDLHSFMQDVVSTKTEEIAEKGMDLNYENLELNENVITQLASLVQSYNKTEVEFDPMLEDDLSVARGEKTVYEIEERTHLKPNTLEK